MKADIHPKYFKNAKATCVCGNSFETGSTLEHIKVDICSECHPFYTGKQKLIDSEGRIEAYRKKYAKLAK